jgi:DNA-directed RNA polymerase specialized sigma24 family protein
VAAGPAGEFEQQRARLFGLAYRLLGSAADAEDVVQDTYVRWSGADQAAIMAPRVWLARVATNLCLNRLASAPRTRVAAGLAKPRPAPGGSGD